MNYCWAKRLGAILLLLMTIVPAWGQSPDSLTVREAMQLAVKNHPAVQQALETIRASQARINESRSSTYPQVSLEGSYVRLDPVSTFNIGPGESIEVFPHNNYDAHVSISQTIYDFGRRRAAIELASSMEQSAEQNAELVKSELAYRTAGVFFGIIFLRNELNVIDDQLATLNEHILRSQKLVQSGSATDFDVLTTEVRVASVKTRRVDITNMLEKEKDVFRQLTGLPPDAAVIIKGEFSPDTTRPAADSMIIVAMSQLSAVKLSRDAETSANIRYNLASLGNRPAINAIVQLGVKNGYTPDLNARKANWVGGLQISAPIFDGFLSRGRREEARAEISAAKSHTSDIERQVASEVRQALSDLNAGLEKIQTAEPQVAQAEEAVSMAKVRYEAGVITNLDLLDAETALSDAKLVHLRAMYEYVISRYALDQAVGNTIW